MSILLFHHRYIAYTVLFFVVVFYCGFVSDECNDDEIQKEATYTRQSDVYLKCTVWLSNEGRYINCGSVTSERISQLSQPSNYY